MLEGGGDGAAKFGSSAAAAVEFVSTTVDAGNCRRVNAPDFFRDREISLAHSFSTDIAVVEDNHD